MSRIKNKFAQLKAENRKAFISYIMACDPDEGVTAALLEKLPRAGVDIIELGIPFSDPMAEGPTIQRAAVRALKTKCNIEKCLELVKNFRKGNAQTVNSVSQGNDSANATTPVVMMGYYNPIFIYGVEKFCMDAASAGVDGIIIVDLPPEEEAEFTQYSNREKLDFIRLTTPTTDEKRAEVIFKNASGFVYYVAVAGVTGVKEAVKSEVQTAVNKLRGKTSLPICVGFGIKNAETAKAISETADGIVIGSAFISIIEDNLNDPAKAIEKCVEFAKAIKAAIS